MGGHYSPGLGRASYIPVRVWTHGSAGNFSSLSFIQMQHDLLNGQRDASRAPLTLADDDIVPSSHDVAVPADSLGPSRRLLAQHRAELEWFALPDNRSMI